MRRVRFALPVLLLFLAVSCASNQAIRDAGSAPTVVRAEQLREGATDTVAAFLNLERLERKTPGTASFLNKPAIHVFAQKLRGAECGIPDEASDARKLELLAACPGTMYHAMNRLTGLIEAYKANMTPTGEADLTTWMATVIEMVKTVNQYMAGGTQ